MAITKPYSQFCRKYVGGTGKASVSQQIDSVPPILSRGVGQDVLGSLLKDAESVWHKGNSFGAILPNAKEVYVYVCRLMKVIKTFNRSKNRKSSL